MRKYELTVVTGQNIPPAKLEEEISSLESFIKEIDGEIYGVDRCGLRSLAYEIKKNKRGYYILFKLGLDQNGLDEINEKMRFSSIIIRHLLVKVEDFGPNPLAINSDDASSDDNHSGVIDYKNVKTLTRYINIVGKILPARITKLSLKVQRQVREAINQARIIALLGYGP